MAVLGASPALTYVPTTSQSFSGNGSQTIFTLNASVAANTDIEVLVDNVQQSPFDGSYTVGGTTLTFSEAPDSGTNNIYVVYRAVRIIATTQMIPDNGSVNTDKIIDQSITSSKLADGAVVPNIANNTITSAHLSVDATNMVMLAQGSSVTGLTYLDFAIDVTKYKTYKLIVRDMTMSNGTSMSIDMLHSTGTFDGWYGGVHAVGEANTAGSHAVFSNASSFNPAGAQTADQLGVYSVNGEFTLHIATRHSIIYNMFGRFNGGAAQVFNGGALSTLDATPTYLRFGASTTITRFSYAWYAIKGGL